MFCAWTAEGTEIIGTVEGTADSPYIVSIDLSDFKYNDGIGECTCPVSFSCKHVVAVLLHALYVKPLSLNHNFGTLVSASTREGTNAGDHLGRSWMQFFELGESNDSQYSDYSDQPREIAVALVFELRKKARQRHEYGPGQFNSRSDNLANSNWGLFIRPNIKYATDTSWRNKHFSWETISSRSTHLSYYRGDNLEAPTNILKVFREIWALYCVDNNVSYYSIPTWIELDSITTPRLWDLLMQLQAFDIPFIYNVKTYPRIDFSTDPARVIMKMDLIEHSTVEPLPKDVKITTEIVHNGEIIYSGKRHAPQSDFGHSPTDAENPETIHFVGNPAFCFYHWEGNLESKHITKLFLAPVEKPLGSSLSKIIESGREITIPAVDLQFFKHSYMPQISRQLEVVSDSVDLSIPKFYPPKLILSVNTSQAFKFDISLSWLYQIDDSSYNLPYWPDVNETLVRQLDAEQLLRITFLLIMTEYFDGIHDLISTISIYGVDCYIFVTEVMHRLQMEDNIEVNFIGSIPDFSYLTSIPEIAVSANESKTDHDWFDIEVSISIGGVKVPYEQLLRAVSNNEEHLLLENNVILNLNHPELHKLHTLVKESQKIRDRSTNSIAISKYQASFWEDLTALGTVTHQVESWNKVAKSLLDFTEVPIAATPVKLTATLRPYQETGYSWLRFLAEHELGGVLADEMGLGKTVQVIAMITSLRDTEGKPRKKSAKGKSPFLIVCPTSVCPNWIFELSRFAPHLKALYVSTTQSKSAVANGKSQNEVVGSPKTIKENAQESSISIMDYDVIITSYTIMRLDEELYQSINWAGIIFDEAQFIKNYASKSYACARKLTAPFKLGLTGTPMENNLMELWSLMSLVAPGLFPNSKSFREIYQKPIESGGNTEILEQLRRRIHPFMLRRTKDQVLKDLPPKIEQVLELDLVPSHRKIYDIYLEKERQRVLGLLGDFQKNRFTILKSLTTLRLLSLSPRLVDATRYAKVPSIKVTALIEQLTEIIAEGHKALVFSQFTSFLAEVKGELDKCGINYSYLDGKTRSRARVIQEFKDGDRSLFLISLKAGGVGLNLTEADYCFILDPWWNPAAENQAIDRTHRIGQTKPVNVYRLVIRSSIEEKIMLLKKKKERLFKDVIDGGDFFAEKVTAEDIRELFTQ
ncbi:MAG: DEAD/DEAH box helicase family protein [Acidimicrobiales bacterium]|nr:DEAD/DEAH box helicase family protein [Acidimicrobiales bacterium]